MDQAINHQEVVLNVIRHKGPVVPVQISAEIKKDLIITGAMLSDLVSKSKLKISSIKIGGSPLYYIPGQEERLQYFSKNLHEKELRAYEKLKSELILQDSKLDPVTRVALRQIKDFANPLDVTIDDTKEIYWKWYLIPKEQAAVLIEKKAVKKPEPKTVEPAEKPIEQQKLVKTSYPKLQETKDFAQKVESHFRYKEITIESSEVIRKNREFDYILKVPTKMGDVRFFCKSKNKKICNDGDVSSVIVQAQIKRLPGILLTNGKLSKKAQEFIDNNPGAITIKYI